MASYYSSPGQHWRRVQEELLHKNEGLKEEHGRLQEEIDTLVDLLLQKDRDEPRIQVGTRKREYTIEDLFGAESDTDDTFEGSKGITCVHHVHRSKRQSPIDVVENYLFGPSDDVVQSEAPERKRLRKCSETNEF